MKYIHYLLFCFFFTSVTYATDSPKNVPDLMLANTYQSEVSSNDFRLDDYWVSEKLDGVRAYWNGENFISRKGNVYPAPDWFTNVLPKTPLDGELWLGQGKFEELSGIVRRQSPGDSDWQNVKFMVFDLPVANSNVTTNRASPFDERLKQLRKIISDLNAEHIHLVAQYKVQTQEALMKKLDDVVEQGGEGLMLHLGTSFYKGGRSNDLLKVKKYEDAEAVVIAHMPGQGKYLGMLGALLVETTDKKRFKIGTGFSDEERQNPPAIGELITYKYYGLTSNGLPRFASFMRIRKRH